MIQHLLLITVVPALLVMGHPIRLLDESGHAGRRLVGALQCNWVFSVLSNPVVALAFYTVVLVGTHRAYNRMLARLTETEERADPLADPVRRVRGRRPR